MKRYVVGTVALAFAALLWSDGGSGLRAAQSQGNPAQQKALIDQY